MGGGDFILVTDTDELKHITSRLAGRQLLALDLETEGLDPHQHRVVLLGVGDTDLQALVDCRQVDLEPLRPVLEGSAVKVTHNGAFDVAMLRPLGLRVHNVRDTMLNEQLLRNGRGSGPFSLAALSQHYLGVTLDKSERLGFTKQLGEFSAAQLEYARRDLLATFQIMLEQAPRLERDGLGATARLEGQALPAFADLHYDGIYLDRDSWQEVVDEARQRRDHLRGELDDHFRQVASTDLFGQVTLNYESDAELRQALERLCKKRLGEINKQTLRRLDHPVAELLIEYREQAKIVSTYGESFLEAIHPRTGRIHAAFHQLGAPTGRVSCSNPNLQNIPRGSRFRRCFRAPAERLLVTADYSGCELRILAELSGDESFLRVFNSGGDLHALVATEIFGRTVSKSSNPELRERAKAINFGLAYGMGAGGLAQVTGLSLEAAEQLLNRYFRAYPRVRQYLEDSAARALRRGWAETIGGRRLWLAGGDDPQQRAALQRVAKNMPIQGTNADILKTAMTGLRRRLLAENLPAVMVNCVHDELLVEAAADQAYEIAELVVEEMVRAGERYIKKVPVVVDASVAECWQK